MSTYDPDREDDKLLVRELNLWVLRPLEGAAPMPQASERAIRQRAVVEAHPAVLASIQRYGALP